MCANSIRVWMKRIRKNEKTLETHRAVFRWQAFNFTLKLWCKFGAVVNGVIMEILEDKNLRWLQVEKKPVELIDFWLFRENIAINPNKVALSVLPFAVFAISNGNRSDWMWMADDLVHRVGSETMRHTTSCDDGATVAWMRHTGMASNGMAPILHKIFALMAWDKRSLKRVIINNGFARSIRQPSPPCLNAIHVD